MGVQAQDRQTPAAVGMEFALAMLTLQGRSVISVCRAFMVPVVLVRD